MIVEVSNVMDFFTKAMARMMIRRAFEKQISDHLQRILEHHPWTAADQTVLGQRVRNAWGGGLPGLLGLPPPEYTVEVELDEGTGVIRANVNICVPTPAKFIDFKISLCPDSES